MSDDNEIQSRLTNRMDDAFCARIAGVARGQRGEATEVVRSERLDYATACTFRFLRQPSRPAKPAETLKSRCPPPLMAITKGGRDYLSLLT